MVIAHVDNILTEKENYDNPENAQAYLNCVRQVILQPKYNLPGIGLVMSFVLCR